MSREDRRLEVARRAIGPHRVVEGFGTVELERAVATLGADGTVEVAPDDELLGAFCRLVRRPGATDPLVLLEPSTEGLLAAALARHGEGRVVTYLVPDRDAGDSLRAAGVVLSREAGTPLGAGRLVLGGDRWGPHVVVVSGAATIER